METINNLKPKELKDFLGKYKMMIVLSVMFSALSSICTLIPFICIYYVVYEIIKYLPDLNYVNYDVVIKYGWMAVFFAIIALIFYLISLMFSHIVAFNTIKNIKSSILKHIAKLPIGFYTNHTSGELRKIIDENSEQTETFIAHRMPDLVGVYVTPIAIIGMLLFFDWKLGLITLITIIIGFLVQMKMMTKESMEFMKIYQTSLEKMNNEAVEYVRGIAVVKVFGQTIYSFKSFYNAIMEYKKYVSSFSKSCQKPMTLFTTIINGVFIFLVPSGILFLLNSSNYKEFLLSFIFYIIFTPACAVMLMRIMYSSEYKMTADEAMRRLNKLFLEKPLEEANINKVPKSSNIAFEKVSFSYPNSKNLAIKNISFNIQAGKTVALVGPSGGGKTTLATLLLRFFEIDKGAIKIGAIDIRDIKVNELMKQIAFVFQDLKLFKGTILDNIKMGKPNASKKEVEKAIEAAMCNEIIEKLPNGVDTVIGSQGTYLSGGEIQRIALARAILKDAPIIVLDEATAFADPENENKIQKAFLELKKGKTVLMIAHRLTTIKNASEIIVIEDGEIVEKGTHYNLIKYNGIYTKMWNNYQKSIEWTVKKK
ncbi:ABC transporter ATP-binding protein [Clostridium botulinum]|uniref:ABC transporter ATP-binding protein n=1 Tax=Clostridium botulinum TaxID=1491 RepID=A0A6M0SV93_CLOBO|nr:ABC transporter ATP-binding protein [Clostridium botulinum]